MYFIREGTAAVIKAGGSGKAAELASGSFFGEMAVLQHGVAGVRNNSVIAMEKCVSTVPSLTGRRLDTY